MKTIYFTLTGAGFHYGDEFLKTGMEVRLIKEPDNKRDKEAIRVEMDGLGKVGYVANSVHTVLGESVSAGRLYDRIGDTAMGKVLYKLHGGVLCEVNREWIMHGLGGHYKKKKGHIKKMSDAISF